MGGGSPSGAAGAVTNGAGLGAGGIGGVNVPPVSTAGGNSAMPQMVLTSGQVAQGVQGAQLLIPTSQGKVNGEF